MVTPALGDPALLCIMSIDPLAGLAVPPAASWSAIVAHRRRLRIVDVAGGRMVTFLCYAAEDPAERYDAPTTVLRAGSLQLSVGNLLYSNLAKGMMRIAHDDCGRIDTIAGCCSGPRHALLYGVDAASGCREGLLRELARHDLAGRDIVPSLNLFAAGPLMPGDTLEATGAKHSASRARDRVELEALRDVLVVLVNCPQVDAAAVEGRATDIRVAIM